MEQEEFCPKGLWRTLSFVMLGMMKQVALHVMEIAADDMSNVPTGPVTCR